MQPIRSPELLKEDDDDDDSDERVMTLVSSFSFLFQMFAFRSASVYFFLLQFGTKFRRPMSIRINT